MKLLKTGIKELTRTLNGGGLLTCELLYEVTKAKGDATYTGPKITRETWAPVLSFLRWVNDTTHSEAQVRMFVNEKEGLVAFWAFPQEARTGMSAREIANDAAAVQRAQFGADWQYFGTTHSHCSAGAFQSTTDEANESSQDGLHITIGHLDKKKLDLHSRFYRQGDLYEVDLAQFWDIGDALSLCPPSLRSVLPDNAEDLIAKQQMCEPSEIEFPAIWKENLIEIKTITPANVGFHGYRGANANAYAGQSNFGTGMHGIPRERRIRLAISEIRAKCAVHRIEVESMEQVLGFIVGDEIAMTIFKVCSDFDIAPDDVWMDLDEVDDTKRIADKKEEGGTCDHGMIKEHYCYQCQIELNSIYGCD